MRRRRRSKKDECNPCDFNSCEFKRDDCEQDDCERDDCERDDFKPFCPVKGVEITDTCLIEIKGCFFLLVALESDVPKVNIKTIVSISITEEQACRLLRAGVRECCIFEDKDECECECECDNIEACFRCIIVLKGQAFKVFIIKGEIVLVPTPLCKSTC